MTVLKLGPYEIHRIEELVFPYAGYADLIPDMPVELIEEHREILTPQQYQADKGLIVLSFHSWLIRTRHHWILVDTCIGNHKIYERKELAAFSRLDTAYLARLRGAGPRPEDIDYVFCTHLHFDHCGWNTSLVDGRWQPTFPNARYLCHNRELQHWAALNDAGKEFGPHLGVYQSNVEPLIEGGLLEGVEDGYELEDGVRLRLAAGHTPGHTVLELGKDGSHGLFSGDLLHAVMQVYGPQYTTVFCDDGQAAAVTRRQTLERIADRSTLLFPAHFGHPHYGRVESTSSGFKFLFGQG